LTFVQLEFGVFNRIATVTKKVVGVNCAFSCAGVT
jgi:hypothetical protein